MKKRFGAMICSLLFSLMLVACGERDQAKTFLPLKPDVTWYYDVDVQGNKLEMQVKVGETEIIEGKVAYPLSYSYNQLALPTQIEYYVPQEKAILFTRIDNVQGQFLKKPFQTLFKFPLKEGDKWEWSGKLVPVGKKDAVASGTVKIVVESRETVSTPSGTYKKALRISFASVQQSNGEKFEIKEDRWYVNKIGMVKEVLYDEKGNQILIAVLKKFKK